MNADNSSLDSKKDMPAIRVTEITESGRDIANLNKPSLMKMPISQTESKSNSIYLNSGHNESDADLHNSNKKHNDNSFEESDYLCLPSSGLVSHL